VAVADGRRWTTGLAVLAVCATVVTIRTDARADAASERKAEALFREGRGLLERGDVAKGCAKLEASLALVRRASTVLNLADCDERRGQLGRAIARWQEGIALLPAADMRVGVARERLASVRKRVPRLSLRLEARLPAGARVELDGAPLAESEVEGDHQLDPGPHVVVVVAPHHADARSELVLGEGERRPLVLALGASDGTAPPEAAAPSRGTTGVAAAGFVVGGLGLAGLAVGAVTGGLTIAKKNVVDDNCSPTCNDASREAATAGKALSAASTVSFIAGGALTVTGIVLVAVGSKRTPTTTLAAAPGPGGTLVTMRGSF
jgi:hypothetical protein